MSDKSDFYKPTAYLRFVQRSIPIQGDPYYGRIENILQQRWTSPFVGDPDQWRDVPIVEDDA